MRRKKDIRLSTTMVESSPKRGEMTSTASKAFFMKNMEPGCAHSKGSRSTMEYHRFNCSTPFPERDETRPGIHGRTGLLLEART